MKDKLFIDFESRSEADLTKVGSHRYATDPSTEVILVTWAFNDELVNVASEVSEELAMYIENPNILKIAQNAEFDMCLVKYVLGLDIVFSAWYDNAYKAAYYSYPRKLKHLAKLLNCTQKGSQEDLFLFSQPKEYGKSEDPTQLFFQPTKTTYHEKADNVAAWQRFEQYGILDTEVLRETYNKMPDMPDVELFKMRLTFEMNFNGVPFDAKLALRIQEMADRYTDAASVIASQKYGISNLRSTVQVKNALELDGVMLDSLNKKERNGETHEILELRDQASGSAFSKIKNALARICSDGRLHGEFVGNGTHTGRWSSKGTQLQNFSRILSLVSETLDGVRDYSHLREHLRLTLGYTRYTDFVCADESQIEARIVAWMANSKWRMEAFKNGDDIYARSAEKMFNIEHVRKEDIERQYGKNAELGFGYGGGHSAIQRIVPDFHREQGIAKIQELVDRWRSSNPEIVNLWYTIQNGFSEASKNGRAYIRLTNVTIPLMFDGKTMRVDLPIGRCLYYRGFHISEGDMYYMDYSRGGETAVRTKVWGGGLLENLVQAIATDVLLDVAKRVHDKDVAPINGTVHDELWYIPKKGQGESVLNVLLEEMARPIPWANGLVTKGDGFTSDRYRK